MSEDKPKTALSDLKLFHVSVSLDFDMAVFAPDEEGANKVARGHWSTEMFDAGHEPDFSSQEMTDRPHTHGDVDPDALPWAPEGTACENGCENPQRTLAEYMEERGLKK